MSSQPSQSDVARSNVASAAQTVAKTLDPSQAKDDDQIKKEPTLKDKLDRAAYTSTDKAADPKKETLVEKAASYIPGLSSMLGTGTEAKETGTTIEKKQENPTPGPSVERPDHDINVEEFIRDQYKSKSGTDMPDGGENSRGVHGQE